MNENESDPPQYTYKLLAFLSAPPDFKNKGNEISPVSFYKIL